MKGFRDLVYLKWEVKIKSVIQNMENSIASFGDGWGSGYSYSQYGTGLSVSREGKFAGAPPQQSVAQVSRVFYDSRNRPANTNTNSFQMYLPKHANGGVLSVEVIEFFFPVPSGMTPPDYVNLCIDKLPVMKELQPDGLSTMQTYYSQSNGNDPLFGSGGMIGGPTLNHTPQTGITLQAELEPIPAFAGQTQQWCRWRMGKGQRAIIFFPREDISRMSVRITDYRGDLVLFGQDQYVKIIMEIMNK
jgi:hypothetical protein